MSGCGLLGKFTSSRREELESVSGGWGAQSVLETGAVQEEKIVVTTSMVRCTAKIVWPMRLKNAKGQIE